MFHINQDKLRNFWDCAIDMCLETPGSALFLSSSNPLFVLHYLSRTKDEQRHRCPIIKYTKPVTATATALLSQSSTTHLFDIIEMLILSQCDDMLVFLHSTYSQAAYSLGGITPVNEHCIREPHTVPPDVCFHWESSIFWESGNRVQNSSTRASFGGVQGYIWPRPAQLEMNIHGSAGLEGCDGVSGAARPTHCCRAGDGHLNPEHLSHKVLTTCVCDKVQVTESAALSS